jgi:membrane-associated phospholipid phosphatase
VQTDTTIPPVAGQVEADGRLVAWRLLAAAAVALVGAAACYLLLVRTSLGQRFDNAAVLGSRQALPSARALDGEQLRHITSDSFAVVLIALVAIGLLRRRVWLGVAAALAAGIAVVGTDVLKDWILTRPDLTTTDFLAPNQTFPSGHTATAVACALALMLVSPPRWRGLAAVVAGAYAWVVAAQVQTAGWHRPSDAIAGALLAFASVAAVGAVVAWLRPVAVRWSRPHHIALFVLTTVALIATAATTWGLIRVLSWIEDHLRDPQTTTYIRHDAYLTGVSVTVLVVVLLVMALLVLLGGTDLDHVDPSTTTQP